MASSSALVFGQRLVESLLPTTLAAGSSLVISPLSVWFALLLVLSGSGPSSVTFNELWSVVAGNTTALPGANSTAALAALNNQAAGLQAALGRQATGNNTLAIANGIWTKDIALKPAYAGEMQRLFRAEARSVPDAAPINAWAANATNNMIKEVLPANAIFDMALTNAVYLKALWEYPFNAFDTSTKPFKALVKGSNTSQVPTEEVFVPTLHQEFKPADAPSPTRAPSTRPQVALSEIPGKYRAIRLPYKGSASLAAVFVLPDASFASVADAAWEISGEAVLQPSVWGPIQEKLKLALPKFEVKADVPLEKVLKSMGIAQAFTGQADFSAASDTPLFLSSAVQAVYVRVDEEGTEAAAVTVLGLTRSAPPQQMQDLTFDRPFLFFIVDSDTQTVLFQGAITDPRGAA